MARRSLSFYLLLAFFGLFVLFLYGPMVTIFILSLQGPEGTLTFPLRSFGLYWLGQVFQEQRVGNFVEPFWRSLGLGLWLRLPPWSVPYWPVWGFGNGFEDPQ